MDEGRKRVLLIAASILAARKLAQYDGGSGYLPRSLRYPMPSAGLRKSYGRLTTVGPRRVSGHRVRQRQRTTLCAILSVGFNV